MSHGYVFYASVVLVAMTGTMQDGHIYAYRREASRCSFRRTGQCEGLKECDGQQVQVLTLFVFMTAKKYADLGGLIGKERV